MSKMASTSTTSTAGGVNLKDPPGSTSANDGFVPRRSNRVSADLAQPDGDTWRERLAVCEGQGAKLVIRSYYKNSRTAGRVWDEPPSGASNIQHATADMRKHANKQLNELQFTLDMIPPEENMDANADTDVGDDGGGGSNKKGKKGGFLGRFRKKEKPKKKTDDSKDLNLQRAIARSMADQKGGPGSDEPVVYYDPDSPTNMADDEALEMAKALSMSESENPSGGGGGGGSSHLSSEEEMFQRALEASQRETSGVASYMPDHEALVYQSPMDTPMPQAASAAATVNSMNDHDSHQDLDQKMAAKPEATRPSELFDPYSNETTEPARSSSMQGGATYTSTVAASYEPTSPSRPKMEADVDGKGKPGRKIALRVFGGKKAMEDEAGMV
jgi:hypothetical protein